MIAGELQRFKAKFFRALSHPTRIRMLEILLRGGRTVQELQKALTLDQPIVSQQLAVLRNQEIVSAQKEGSSVRYALRDPLVGELLDLARRIFDRHLASTRGLLRELRREGRPGSSTIVARMTTPKTRSRRQIVGKGRSA
jgi:DNA-binding transcriptional ArsR family regulator